MSIIIFSLWAFLSWSTSLLVYTNYKGHALCPKVKLDTFLEEFGGFLCLDGVSSLHDSDLPYHKIFATLFMSKYIFFFSVTIWKTWTHLVQPISLILHMDQKTIVVCFCFLFMSTPNFLGSSHIFLYYLKLYTTTLIKFQLLFLTSTWLKHKPRYTWAITPVPLRGILNQNKKKMQWSFVILRLLTLPNF